MLEIRSEKHWRNKWNIQCFESLFSVQKQPFANVLQISCSLNFLNTDKKTPVLESRSDKVAALKACNFMKKDSNTGVFLRILQKILRTDFWELMSVELQIIRPISVLERPVLGALSTHFGPVSVSIFYLHWFFYSVTSVCQSTKSNKQLTELFLFSFFFSSLAKLILPILR